MLTAIPTPTLLPEADRQTIFNRVWDIVDRDYLYQDYNGVDWVEIGDRYEPKALSATTSQQFYGAISEMVDQLKDDHSRYLAPWEARDEDDFINGHVSYTGIGTYGEPGNTSIAVFYVFPNSPAEKAGIKRRDHIIAVDGRPITDGKNQDVGIRGDAFTNVRVTVKSPGQAPREIVLQREPVAGRVNASGRLLEADPTIGYLVVPSLQVRNMDTQVEGELTRLRDKALLHDQPLHGLIIDLRGNGGGWISVLKSVLGQFVTGTAGMFYSNNDYVQSQLEAQGTADMNITKGSLYDDLHLLPVVVLVDKETASAAEILAASLQNQRRAQVVGTTSAGNTEEIFYYNLKDGSRLWLAEEAFRLPNGAGLEGIGVVPDSVVDVDWTNYTEQDDPQIQRAVQLIHQAGGH